MPRLLLGLLLAALASAQTVTTITSPGAGTWTAPAGVTSIKVECIGGGGGGATRTTTGAGGGGGGGAYAARLALSVTPGVAYSYTVGAAGLTNGGGNGGPTSFTGDGSVQCVAAGGASVANESATGGAGGLAASSVGDSLHVFSGGSGANGVAGSYGGGGGGSGGSASNGSAATNGTGATAVTGGGPGGNGKTSPQGAGGAPANGPGGGGGGGLRTSSGTRSGGAGWAGQIRITYNTLTTAKTEGVVLTSAAAGQYSNNSAKTAEVVENIQHVPANQSRWGQAPVQVGSIRDIGGQGHQQTVTERSAPSQAAYGLVPAQNYSTEVAEHIQHTPSTQTRLVYPETLALARKDVASGSTAGSIRYTATVVENIPHTPANHFDWGAGPSEAPQTGSALSQAYTPGVPAAPLVPRIPAVIR